AHNFDVKWLLRQIALSDTYQRSSEVPAGLTDVPPDRYLVANLKPLSPEQLAYAVVQATGPAQAVPDGEANVAAFVQVVGGRPGGCGRWSRRPSSGSTIEARMTSAELDDIESRLSVRLPACYREFMLDYPPALVETKKDFGWFRESPADRQLQNSARSLLEMNEDLRRPGTPWTAEDGPWPPCYFAIGNDQCGNYWCIDLKTTDPGIWFYD